MEDKAKNHFNKPQRNPRLEKILGRFGESDEGKRLLDFAGKNGVSFSFDDRMGPDSFGDYRSEGNKAGIFINPLMSDDILVSNLYHELRHAEQDRANLFIHSGHMNDHPAIWPVKNPWAFFILNRVLEADAFTKQIDASFHHDEGTKDALRANYPELFHTYRKSFEETCPGDRIKARQGVFMDFMDLMTNEYDVRCIHKLKGFLDHYHTMSKRDPALAKMLFSTNEKFGISTGLFRLIAEQADGTNHLKNISDEQLISVLKIKPSMDAELTALEKDFKMFFDGQKPSPPGGKGPSP